MSENRFYVTTPIYYVNDRPHVGHAYSSVLADVLAGYHELLGYDTWFLSGTDEHGQKIQDSAEERGVTPQELCDEMSAHFRALLERLEIRNDEFIRTTEERHKTVVSQALTQLHEQGDVYLAEYAGWYCAKCERYWTQRDVEERGGGNCPDQPDLHTVEQLEEANYFFRMSKYADALRAAISDRTLRIVPDKRRNEVLGFLDQDVQDLCISRSRDRLDWGVPLPFDDKYVCYVWVDALINYQTAVGYFSDDERHAKWWPADVHLIGKDILTTHAVYWPTLLLALGQALPRRILAHGWLLDPQGGKLSKSKRLDGDTDAAEARPQPTIDGLLDVFGAAATRWFLATAMKPGSDTSFSWDIVRERVNTDLANGLGNTANRLLKMVGNTCGGAYPTLGDEGEGEAAVREAALAAVESVRALPEDLDVTRVAAAVRDAIAAISLYLSNEAPWKLAKDEATHPRAAEILACALEALRLAALAAHPIVPNTLARLRDALGLPATIDFDAEARWGLLAAGAELGGPPNLFPRVNEDALPTS